jgi:dolichol-phosphate mannosyltransferase
VPQPWLTVVIPTYNEAANIGPLLAALRQTLGTIPVEYVVVDDASKDGTPEAAAAAAPDARVIVRRDERGLATAVVRGLREATGTYVAVMDADFQHPPSAVLAMLEKALDEDADLVIGSRYAAGGSQGNFGPVRRLISWGAGTIGRLALPPVRRFKLTDPMSGLFLVRRDKVDVDSLRPSGYKILLEILGRAPLERVTEAGYVFQDRRGGESKLGAGVMGQYLAHAVRLGIDHPENRRMAKFALVGMTGVVVNLALLWLLHGRLGLHDLVAVPIAVEASILSNFLLNDRFTFHDRQRGHAMKRLLQFNTVSLLALLVNLAAYTILAKGIGLHYLLAEAIAIVVAFGANYMGNLQWTYRPERV